MQLYVPAMTAIINVHSSITNEKDHHYVLNRFVCVGELFDD